MQSSLPGIFIERGTNIKEVEYESYSTLFLSFTVGTQCINPIVLKSLSDISKYSFLHESYMITNAIKVYFENGGKKLYILSQPQDDEILLNQEAYVKYLSTKCDTIVDIETIVAVDLFRKNFSDDDNILIQNILSDYCANSNRIYISDISKSIDKYVSGLYDTVAFYPWLKDKKQNIIPPSVVASALFNSVALSENISVSIANRVLNSIVEVEEDLSINKYEELYNKGITPILDFREEGFKIWGVRTLNFSQEHFTYLNTLRVFRYIKRTLHQITRQYVFEPNSYDLKNRLTRTIRYFLFDLWKKGVLLGSSEDEAFVLICDERNNSTDDHDAGRLNIDIAVAISKPLEFITIRLNRVQEDMDQANINIS